MTRIIKCTCIHAQQDKLYGKRRRVMNQTKDGQYRCTVCAAMHGGRKY